MSTTDPIPFSYFCKSPSDYFCQIILNLDQGFWRRLKVSLVVWCKSTRFSWVDSPDQENGSVELLGSPERKWGVPGE